MAVLPVYPAQERVARSDEHEAPPSSAAPAGRRGCNCLGPSSGTPRRGTQIRRVKRQASGGSTPMRPRRSKAVPATEAQRASAAEIREKVEGTSGGEYIK